jgi:general nucleoside transport system permease protein
VLVTLGALLMAALAVTAMFVAYGVEPVAAWGTIVRRTLLEPRGLSETLRKATPLLLAGIGLLLAFRARFWNIGAEGQLLAGAVGATAVALFGGLPAAGRPRHVPRGRCSPAPPGAPLPALLKARWGVNEIITTLMFNYIALYVVRWLINGPWKARSATGFSYSERFPPRPRWRPGATPDSTGPPWRSRWCWSSWWRSCWRAPGSGSRSRCWAAAPRRRATRASTPPG